MLPLYRGFTTFQAFDAIQLGEQLVDHAVCDARGVMAPARRDGVKLVKEQNARRSSAGPPARDAVSCVIVLGSFASRTICGLMLSEH